MIVIEYIRSEGTLEFEALAGAAKVDFFSFSSSSLEASHESLTSSGAGLASSSPPLASQSSFVDPSTDPLVGAGSGSFSSFTAGGSGVLGREEVGDAPFMVWPFFLRFP